MPRRRIDILDVNFEYQEKLLKSVEHGIKETKKKLNDTEIMITLEPSKRDMDEWSRWEKSMKDVLSKKAALSFPNLSKMKKDYEKKKQNQPDDNLQSRRSKLASREAWNRAAQRTLEKQTRNLQKKILEGTGKFGSSIEGEVLGTITHYKGYNSYEVSGQRVLRRKDGKQHLPLSEESSLPPWIGPLYYEDQLNKVHSSEHHKSDRFFRLPFEAPPREKLKSRAKEEQNEVKRRKRELSLSASVSREMSPSPSPSPSALSPPRTFEELLQQMRSEYSDEEESEAERGKEKRDRGTERDKDKESASSVRTRQSQSRSISRDRDTEREEMDIERDITSPGVSLSVLLMEREIAAQASLPQPSLSLQPMPKPGSRSGSRSGSNTVSVASTAREKLSLSRGSLSPPPVSSMKEKQTETLRETDRLEEGEEGKETARTTLSSSTLHTSSTLSLLPSVSPSQRERERPKRERDRDRDRRDRRLRRHICPLNPLLSTQAYPLKILRTDPATLRQHPLPASVPVPVPARQRQTERKRERARDYTLGAAESLRPLLLDGSSPSHSTEKIIETLQSQSTLTPSSSTQTLRLIQTLANSNSSNGTTTSNTEGEERERGGGKYSGDLFRRNTTSVEYRSAEELMREATVSFSANLLVPDPFSTDEVRPRTTSVAPPRSQSPHSFSIMRELPSLSVSVSERKSQREFGLLSSLHSVSPVYRGQVPRPSINGERPVEEREAGARVNEYNDTIETGEQRERTGVDWSLLQREDVSVDEVVSRWCKENRVTRSRDLLRFRHRERASLTGETEKRGAESLEELEKMTGLLLEEDPEQLAPSLIALNKHRDLDNIIIR